VPAVFQTDFAGFRFSGKELVEQHPFRLEPIRQILSMPTAALQKKDIGPLCHPSPGWKRELVNGNS
jgi:hypothetical protein